MITLQYLEPGPHIETLSPQAVRDKFRAVCDLLPIDCLLLGWDLPEILVSICREETAHRGIKLYRWHPLLTGDGTIIPREEWRTQNWRGEPLRGFRGLPEFTFVCPNHPKARTAILSHLESLAQSGLYDGIFLDRMRYPSPAEHPVDSLACFCTHCQRVANDSGIHLDEIRQLLQLIPVLSLLRSLGGGGTGPLATFLDFRQQVVTQFVAEAVKIIRSAGLEVGLDCFSPSLTRLVGQDLSALAPLANWTKLMIYGHARGPATLPYEIGALAHWLSAAENLSEFEALVQIAETLGCSLNTTPAHLHASPDTLVSEYQRGRGSSPRGQLLAGIELVEMPGVSELNLAQIEADLRALRAAGVDGLSLSWDLWHMPLDRLEWVQDIWR